MEPLRIIKFSLPIIIIFLVICVIALFFRDIKVIRENNEKNEKIDSTNFPVQINGTDVQTEIKNVNFRIDTDIIMKIKRLQGELIAVKKNGYPVFDEGNSFKLRIYNAIISLDMKSLSNLLNRYVFGFKGSSLKDIKVSTEGDKLKQEGKMKGIPFTILSEVSVTPEGKIRLHPVKTDVLGINVSGLMKFFKLELEDLLRVDKNRGAEIVDNDFYLDPSKMLPPPRIEGHLEKLQVGKGEVIQTFMTKNASPLNPDSSASNYMYYKGGKLGFGKLTMYKADMEIIDMDQEDPFDFYLNKYLEQLTAGYHVTTKKQGLIIFMPDYDDLKR